MTEATYASPDGIPDSWSYRAADWSAGLCSDLIKHEGCPLEGSDNPLDMVNETFLRKERVNDHTVRFHYRWDCPCGVSVEVHQDDYSSLGNLKPGRSDR